MMDRGVKTISFYGPVYLMSVCMSGLGENEVFSAASYDREYSSYIWVMSIYSINILSVSLSVRLIQKAEMQKMET